MAIPQRWARDEGGDRRGRWRGDLAAAGRAPTPLPWQCPVELQRVTSNAELHNTYMSLIPAATSINSLLKNGRKIVLSLLQREAHGAALAAATAAPSLAPYTSMPI